MLSPLALPGIDEEDLPLASTTPLEVRRKVLQSIPRVSNDKDVVAMWDELTIEANEESFVTVLQHGGNDVTCKRSIDGLQSILR